MTKLLAFGALLGAGMVVAGVYLLGGLAWALVTAGLSLVVACLLVDS